MRNDRLLMLLFSCVFFLFFSTGNAAEKNSLLKKQKNPAKSIKQSSPEKYLSQKKRSPYIEIKNISLDKNNHIVIVLNNIGQASLLKSDYVKGKIFVQTGLAKKKRFFSLAKVDPRFLLKNPGSSYSWTTEILCKSKTQVSVGVQSVNGERKHSQFLQPMLKSFAGKNSKAKKKSNLKSLPDKSKSRIILSDFSFDGQVYPGEEIRFLCTMPAMAPIRDTVNFTLYKGSWIVDSFSREYEPLAGSRSIRPLYHLPRMLSQGADYYIEARMLGFSGKSSTFSILDPDTASGRHVVVHIEPDIDLDGATYAGSRIFVWYEMAEPLPENIRISLGTRTSSRLLYEGEARPGRDAGMYFDLPPDVVMVNAWISVVSWGSTDNHRWGRQTIFIAPPPGNGVFIQYPVGGEVLDRASDIGVAWAYINSGSAGSDRYSIALVNSAGGVTPMGSGFSNLAEGYSFSHVLSIPDFMPEGRYKVRIRYENGLTGISTDYFNIVDGF